MARSHAASALDFANADEGFRRQDSVSSSSRVLSRGALRAFVQFGVPIALLVFVAAICLLAFLFARHLRQQAIEEAAGEAEIVALAIATHLSERLQDGGQPVDKALTDHLPGHVGARQRRIIVADQEGRIVARWPATGFGGATLTDVLGAGQALTILGDKAGVMRIVLPDGAEAFATVRDLRRADGKGLMGQIAIVHLVDDALSDWRAAIWRIGWMMGAALIVTCAVGGAYFWQARKAVGACAARDALATRMDSALERGHCGLWDWDLARGRIHWSRSMYQLLRMTPSTQPLSVGDVGALIHPDDGDLTQLADVLLASHTQTIDHEFRIRNADGDWVWLQARAELNRPRGDDALHLVGVVLDITEQRRLAAQTRAADERLRSAIESISEAFALWDSDNRLVQCNDKFIQFNRLPTDIDLHGMHYDRIMDMATPPTAQTPLAITDTPHFGARAYEAQLSDGRWLQVNERRTEDGGYVSVGADITTLKQHGEKLFESEQRLMNTVSDLRHSRVRLEDQARQLASLAERYLEQKAEAEMLSRAKSQFLNNMSHELRTPLNAIIGFSELMESETFGPLGSDRYHEYASLIRASGQMLLNVITDVLDMSELETGKIQLNCAEFEIDDAINAAIGMVRDKAQTKSLDIVTTPFADGAILGDRLIIEKVLAKVLRNGVRFSPAHGRIHIHCHRDGAMLTIDVADGGCGIAPDVLDRLGRPFEQVSAPLTNGVRGSGLGLAIARSLAELHGGSLDIQSELGHGTIVSLTLPVAPVEKHHDDEIATRSCAA